MSVTSYSSSARAGDLAELVGLRHKHFILNLQAGAKFETHRGILQHDDLIGKPWGTQVFSHIGAPFFLLQPSLADLLVDLPRTTQILYPKDIGFILVTMGVGAGQKVMEAGTGSGSMTTALAYAVGPEGRVISYEDQGGCPESGTQKPDPLRTRTHAWISNCATSNRAPTKLTLTPSSLTCLIRMTTPHKSAPHSSPADSSVA